MLDVAIIGGGPAGATVGTLLKKHKPEMSVAIFEREKFPRDHVGESHLPAISQILDEMGVWEKVEAGGFPIKIGGTYRWGSTDELWDLDFLDGKAFKDEPRPAKYRGQRRKTAFQVDRSVYDQILLEHARSSGCEVHQQVKVVKVERHQDRVTGLEVQSSADSSVADRVESRWYVDCSGDSGVLRRAMEIEVECPTALRNIAIWDYWQDASWGVTLGNGGTRIEVLSLGWGWLWFIPITSTRTSVGLVLPAAYYKKSGKSPERIYIDAIAEEARLSGLLKGARREGKLETTRDWNFVAERLCGDNWFLAGDSCGFADPILSAGMTLAHTSGRKVAGLLLELERQDLDPDWLRKEYSDGHRAQIRHHMQFADYWYSANGRFTDLKEYCSTIADTAGLNLDADSAFRWLATGGFALEEPGLARALSYGVGGLKVLSGRLEGREEGWELTKTNVWNLDAVGASEEKFAYFGAGRVQPILCLRKGSRRLPLTGVYYFIHQALKRNTNCIKILEDCVNAVLRDGCPPDEAVLIVLEGLESMIVEGWIRTAFVAGLPCIKVRDLSPYR